jgi:transposase-like protein
VTRKTKAETRWAALIASQPSSGQSVRAFCGEHGVSEHSFYMWRKRLRPAQRVAFALLEAAPTAASASPWTLELALAGGDVLRIANGADPATLRHILGALRA